MSRSLAHKRHLGFSMIEVMIVVSIILILGAITLPRIMFVVSDIALRMEASDFSGILQSARIQAVRKNTYYKVLQGTMPSGTSTYYVDLPKANAYTNDDPAVAIDPSMTVHQGTGSGAPNEAAFIAGLNFTVSAGAAPVTFDARGLPCTPVSSTQCTEIPGQGYVVFMSKPASMGNSPWMAVVVTASGHVQIWSSDSNGNWVQRD